MPVYYMLYKRVETPGLQMMRALGSESQSVLGSNYVSGTDADVELPMMSLVCFLSPVVVVQSAFQVIQQ